MVYSGSWLGASPYDYIIIWSHLIQGSKLPTVDSIVRTNCWLDSEDVNGLYRFIRISADGVVMVTSEWDSVHMNGWFWLLVGSIAIQQYYHMSLFDSEEPTANGILRTYCWWDSEDANVLYGGY